MNKKNRLPIKLMLGVLLFLGTIVFETHQLSKNMALSRSSNVSSHNNFFQFLANMIGMPWLFNSSGEAPNKNTFGFNQTGNFAGNQQNPYSSTVNTSTLGLNDSQQKNSAGNNLGNNTGNDSELNAKNILDNNPETNPGTNAEYNSEFNAENNPENNPGNSNSETNATDNSELNAENNAESTSVENSGGSPGNNPENNSGDKSGINPENNAEFIDPNNLPTINPIPTDTTVSQSISEQNQQGETIAALVAAHQALAFPVQEQAQASKYQTVVAGSIPAPSTNQAPADVVQKLKSHQVTYH